MSSPEQPSNQPASQEPVKPLYPERAMPDELVGFAVEGDLIGQAKEAYDAHKTEERAKEEAERQRAEEEARAAAEAARQAAEAENNRKTAEKLNLFRDETNESSVRGFMKTQYHLESMGRTDHRGHTAEDRLYEATMPQAPKNSDPLAVLHRREAALERDDKTTLFDTYNPELGVNALAEALDAAKPNREALENLRRQAVEMKDISSAATISQALKQAEAAVKRAPYDRMRRRSQASIKGYSSAGSDKEHAEGRRPRPTGRQSMSGEDDTVAPQPTHRRPKPNNGASAPQTQPTTGSGRRPKPGNASEAEAPTGSEQNGKPQAATAGRVRRALGKVLGRRRKAGTEQRPAEEIPQPAQEEPTAAEQSMTGSAAAEQQEKLEAALRFDKFLHDLNDNERADVQALSEYIQELGPGTWFDADDTYRSKYASMNYGIYREALEHFAALGGITPEEAPEPGTPVKYQRVATGEESSTAGPHEEEAEQGTENSDAAQEEPDSGDEEGDNSQEQDEQTTEQDSQPNDAPAERQDTPRKKAPKKSLKQRVKSSLRNAKQRFKDAGHYLPDNYGEWEENPAVRKPSLKERAVLGRPKPEWLIAGADGLRWGEAFQEERARYVAELRKDPSLKAEFSDDTDYGTLDEKAYERRLNRMAREHMKDWTPTAESLRLNPEGYTPKYGKEFGASTETVQEPAKKKGRVAKYAGKLAAAAERRQGRRTPEREMSPDERAIRAQHDAEMARLEAERAEQDAELARQLEEMHR